MVAAVLAGFFPSLFLWSVANEKEMVIIFLNLVIVLLWIKISKERKWFLLPAILLLIWIQRYFRTYYLMPLLGYSSIVISVFGFLWILRKRIILPFFILLLVFLMFFSWLYPPAKIARQVHTGLSNALMHHIFQAIEKGSSYKILPDDYYRKPDLRRVQELTFKRILVLYCKSIFHFFLEPLPSRINNFSKLLSYPQSIFIYFLLFFFMLGTLLAFKKEPLSSLILFLNFFIFSSLVALSEGNIGGLLRHRDIIMPVFLIFTAFGLAACYEKPENNNRI